MMPSITKFHEQTVSQAYTDDTCYRTGTQMDRQAVLIDICSYFSTWIILLGYPIFSCFTTDVSSSFIYSTISSTLWGGGSELHFYYPKHLFQAVVKFLTLSTFIWFGTICNSSFICTSQLVTMNDKVLYPHRYWDTINFFTKKKPNRKILSYYDSLGKCDQLVSVHSRYLPAVLPD